MPRINLEQGSQEWLDYRSSRIMATDASIVIGSNPFKTPIQLWNEKLGNAVIETNAAMARGQQLEPIARQLFIDQMGLHMEPCVYESDEYSWAAASLDGISDDGRCILEIKCMGEKGHEEAINGVIKSYYRTQVQHQLFVTGADICHYFCYRPEHEEPYIMHNIYPDKEYIDLLIEKEKEFYHKLCHFEEPVEWYFKPR